AREGVMEQVRARFRPEFLNRLDEILLFRRLGRAQMSSIVDIQLARLQKLLTDRKITISVDDAARKLLGDKGYDPAYGARPLKRVIQTYVQNPLAEQLLKGEILDNSTVQIGAKGDKLTFSSTVNKSAKTKAA
ncbi:MAG TPA: ATP-dependent chaperone ClpB, partial [Alphaproteobacteria bacterium]